MATKPGSHLLHAAYCATAIVFQVGCASKPESAKPIPSIPEQLSPVTFQMRRPELVERLPVDKSANWHLLTTPAQLSPMEIATLPSGLRVMLAFNSDDDAITVIHINDERFILPGGLSMRSTARDIKLLHPNRRFLCYHGYASVIEVVDGIRIAFFPWTESDPEPTAKPAWIEIYPEAMNARATTPIHVN